MSGRYLPSVVHPGSRWLGGVDTVHRPWEEGFSRTVTAWRQS